MLNRPVIVIHANTSWYVYRFCFSLIKEFVRAGYKVEIIVPDNEHKLNHEYVNTNVIPLKRSSVNILKEASYIYNLYKILKFLSPKYLFNFTVKCNIYGGLLASKLDIKSINTVSGIGSTLLNRGGLYFIVKYLYKLSSKKSTMIFLNSSDKTFFQGLSIKSLDDIVIPGSGIDCGIYKRKQRIVNNNTFVYIGRLIKDKGINEYLHAAELLSKKGYKFLVVGLPDPGNPTSISTEKVMQLHNEGSIQYLGFIEDVRDIMEKVDCLVLPSYAEGLSRVMLEAASMEVSVLASDVPGCREIVNYDNQCLFTPKSKLSLVDSINSYASLSSKQKTLSKQSRRIFVDKYFSEELVNQKYMETL